jgi:hypothetical protein
MKMLKAYSSFLSGRLRFIFFIFLLFITSGPAMAKIASIGTINAIQGNLIDVSKDLTRLGLATQNITVNDVSLNCVPILDKVIKYASGKGGVTIVFPAGNYYFDNVPGKAGINFENAKDITIQGRGAIFNFKSRKSGAVMVRNSSRIGLQGITIDYQSDLPFTAAVVSSVSVSDRKIYLSSILGRKLTELDNSGKNSIRIFVLRKTGGSSYKSVPITRMAVPPNTPLSNDGLSVSSSPRVPDSQFDNDLSQIKAGDILSISERSYSGVNAISIIAYPPMEGSGNFVKDVTVYASPALGLGTLWQDNFTCSNLQVIPKPGRTQYISSNADGINLTNSGSGCQVQNCTVVASGDDGISVASNLLGTVTKVNSDNEFTVALRYNVQTKQMFTISDPDDLHECGTATVIDSQLMSAVPNQLKQYKLTFDKPIRNVKTGAFMFIPLENRSPGLLIQNNNIEKSNSRGIYLGGVTGVKVISNTISNSNSSGIMLQQLAEGSTGGYKTPGNSDITITSNTIQNAFAFGRTMASGAIEVSISGGNDDSSVSNSKLVIKNNTIGITNKLRSSHVGIFISHAKDCDVNNNVVRSQADSGASVAVPSAQRMLLGKKVFDVKNQ